MIPPKYNFYIGAADMNIYFSSGTGINNSGEFVSESDKYSYGLSSLNENKFIFVNLVSVNSYNAIFFYDSSMNFISYKTLVSSNNTIVVPPSKAKYYAFRFTDADANFMAKKDTNFVYFIESVNPHYKELNKKYAKESGQEFFHISLDGKINLFGSDYELVRNSNLEDKMIFIIDKYNRTSGKWIEYYKGEFNKTDCKLDHEKKSCELKTTAIDSYNEILNKYENTYDLIKLAPAITKINLHKRSLMQVYIRGSKTITNLFGGICWEDDVSEIIDSHSALINKYYFAYIKAGNEFYIENAGIPEVNGVYAGTNGHWAQWNGYEAKLTKVISAGNSAPDVAPVVYAIYSSASRNANIGDNIYLENLYKLQIIKTANNTILYESKKTFYISLAKDDIDNIYIDRDDIQMTNINNSNDIFTISNTFVYHIYNRLLCDVDTIEDSEGIKNTYNLPSDDFVTDNRNYKRCIGLTTGLFFCSSKAVDEPTKYGLNDYGQYFTNKFLSPSMGIGRLLPISRNSWANASLWYAYDVTYPYFEKELRKQYTLRDSYSITAVIKALLNKIDPTIKHEATPEYSRFLYDENVPIPMARFYIHITQKTNILKGEYDQAAQKAEISFEELMKMLRDCFRCYWYIEDNKLKIEHISFFMKGGSYSYDTSVQLDFTKLIDQFNKKLSSYFQSEIEYDKTDLNQRYEFGWMDDVTDLFGGVTIDVKSNYIQKDKTEEINISQFSSDVDYMLFNPSNFSDDGFALLCPVKNGSSLELPIVETQLIDENGDTYNAVIQNFYASWAYLVNFYMYDMPAKSVECNVLNDSYLYVRSIKTCMKHTIEFAADEDLNELELIKTTMGNGKIDEVSINIDTRHAKVKLLYEPQ